MKPATHCYVGRRANEPGAYAACVDAVEHPKDTARFVRDIVKEGGYVERVTVEEARTLMAEWWKWKQEQESQGTLI